MASFKSHFDSYHMPHSWRQNQVLPKRHCTQQPKHERLSRDTSGVFVNLSCKSDSQICHIQYVCLDALYAGRWESHRPFGRSRSGTNGLRGVGLIRLVYCAVMIACTAQGSHLARSVRCDFSPIQGLLKHVLFCPTLSSLFQEEKKTLAPLSLLLHIWFKRCSGGWESQSSLLSFF